MLTTMNKKRTPRIIASDIAYRESHRAEAAARTKAWAAANPDRRRAAYKKYREANKDKIRIQKKAWRKSNPEKHNAANKRWKINRALRICDFDALLKEQGGKCAICRSSDAGRKQSGRLSIDHCHVTDVIRGLLCHRCNSMLGLAKDNTETLRNAIAYLEKPHDSGTVRRREGRLRKPS
jgi:hypothetical protein